MFKHADKTMIHHDCGEPTFKSIMDPLFLHDSWPFTGMSSKAFIASAALLTSILHGLSDLLALRPSSHTVLN